MSCLAKSAGVRFAPRLSHLNERAAFFTYALLFSESELSGLSCELMYKEVIILELRLSPKKCWVPFRSISTPKKKTFCRFLFF